MMKGGGRKISVKPLSERKDRDDQDLVLFRDLHKREKDRMASLLQPVSDDFEPNPGNFAVYRMASGRKGTGYEFFGENNDKNDYDWLKTPPATPLFPSLEMEANAHELLLQRDIPILQPLSRFNGDSTRTKGASYIGRPKSPKPKAVPLRSVIPSQTQRPTISQTETKSNKPTSTFNPKTTTTTATALVNNRKPNVVGNTEKTTTKVLKDNTQIDFLSSNLTKNNIVGTDTKTKPRSRVVSPSTRSTIPTDIPGFSNEAPPNLRTDISRSISATRGRPPAASKKPTPTTMRTDINQSTSTTRGRPPAANTTPPRRQSCSPSVIRGRKVTGSKQLDQADAQTGKSSIKNRNSIIGSGTQIFGSRMVERLMNARSKSGAFDRESSTRPKSQVTASATTKIMSRSSFDATSKHMEMQRDRMFPVSLA